ncbi:NUDIX hydrolase [Tomitella fengzijianii]|uniref:NUDIX hydrolase n=1 Tax=Tomitella fengzijianii TaxID=2597660 RepID=UPI00131DADD1|nr:NUDIX domain-containing protein [Tomitella fengzijianii]
MPGRITVSAVVIRNDAGEVLTVRKRGTTRLMLPGGKPEPGESPEQTAVREAAEELGVALRQKALREIGTFTAPAANEPGCTVLATVFEHPLVAVSSPRAEIAQLEWLDPCEPDGRLAPLLRDAVFPALDLLAGRHC